jgi:hypothetical protein
VARITSPPTAHTNNVQEVAQAVAPFSRIVCADNDPLVLAHARALLTSSSALCHQAVTLSHRTSRVSTTRSGRPPETGWLLKAATPRHRKYGKLRASAGAQATCDVC